MVLTTCWRCLRSPPRLLSLRQTPTSAHLLVFPRAPFSTTSSLAAKKKGNTMALMQKTRGANFKVKKKNSHLQPAAQKHGVIGERKMLRKTVVVSNINATPVQLKELTSEFAGNEDAEGMVFAIPDLVIDKLRTLEVFQKRQNWHFFHRPATLLRKESVEIGKLIHWANGDDVEVKKEGVDQDEKGVVGQSEEEEEEARFARIVITGGRGSGKSILLLQAVAWALQRNWVVINIPNAQDLVIGHTAYEYDSNSELWLQKDYTMELLKKIAKVNNHVFTKIQLSKPYHFGKDFSTSDSLKTLVEIGTSDPAVSCDIFNTLIEELSLPNRPPILFALENLGQISIPTAYRNPEFNQIHPHDLALPNIFLSYLSGNREFHRGLVLAATSSACPRAEALSYALRGEDIPAYSGLDQRIAGSVEGVGVLELGKLTRKDARALMEYHNQSGISTKEVTHESISKTLTLSSGNVKDFLSRCLRITA